MHSKIRRKPVALKPAARPSRIRRDPVVRIDAKAAAEAAIESEKREIWGGVAGVIVTAAGVVAAIVAISLVTIFRSDPDAAAKAAQFGQCYNADGGNCVADGETIYIGGQKIVVAGLEAPKIDNAACPQERDRGIDSALQLADLLNHGKVTVGGTVRGPDGQLRRTVEVNGQDVGRAMIDAGAARDPALGSADWCSSDEDNG